MKHEARSEVSDSSGNSRAGSHAWVRQGCSFEEKVSQPKAEAAQAGIDLVEFHDYEDIAKSNWSPGTVLAYALAGKPHVIAMVHEVQAGYLPMIQNYVALGACRLRGEFFPMPEYPLVYLGLGANVRFIDKASNRYAIFESVMNFVEANFQDWVTSLEAKEYTMLHLIGPDRHHVVTGRVNVDKHVITSPPPPLAGNPETFPVRPAAGGIFWFMNLNQKSIVDAVNRANSAFETSREMAPSFDKAMTRFFHQHPEPLFWSS